MVVLGLNLTHAIIQHMKKSLLKSIKPTDRTQELQTTALIALSVAFVVMVAIIAVLFAQVDGHRESIEALEEAVAS